jgi:hypothetical protein
MNTFYILKEFALNPSTETQNLPELTDEKSGVTILKDQNINKSGKSNRELMAEFFSIAQEPEKK